MTGEFVVSWIALRWAFGIGAGLGFAVGVGLMAYAAWLKAQD